VGSGRNEPDRKAGMPPPQQGPLAVTQDTLPLYTAAYADSNKIETTGCSHLSRGHWPVLNDIVLRKYPFTKRTTKSTNRAPNGSAVPSGTREQALACVLGRRDRYESDWPAGLSDFNRPRVESQLRLEVPTGLIRHYHRPLINHLNDHAYQGRQRLVA
jgi:hypothetical protein